MKPMILSIEWLERHHACVEQVDLALLHFGPRPRKLTRALLLEAAELGLDLDWLAEEVLSVPLGVEYRRQCAPLRAEYERQRAPLLAKYELRLAPLRAEYERQIAPLWAEYERQCAPLLAKYELWLAPLWVKYERRLAPLLADVLGL